MSKSKSSVLTTAVYVVLVFVFSFLLYFTVGGVIEIAVMNLGASEEVASGTNSFISIVIGFVLGDFAHRFLLRRFMD